VTRVVALIATEAVSGPGRQLAALADPLGMAGVQLHVVVLSRTPEATSPYMAHLERERVAYSVIRDRGPGDWRIVRDVRTRLRTLGADVLQTHGYKATAVGWAVRRLSPDISWIAFYHGATDKGARDRFYHAVERSLIGAADRIVIVSPTQRRFVGNHHVSVIANAVLPSQAPAGTADIPAVLRTTARPRIAVIGRLSREKGVDVFLHACAALRARSVPFSALIVGDGPDDAELRQLCHTLQLAEHVHFVGPLAYVQPVYDATDVVVLPSRSEGLPNVLLEALAADRPVVATAVGAVPDVLAARNAGVLVPPGDALRLADGIVHALHDGVSADAAAARRATLRRFTLEQRVELHLALYRELGAPATAPASVSA
jgi:glycosyltransferase involved in cell wall biosynthesis